MDNYLDKLLACEYECDFCKIEIPVRTELIKDRRINRRKQPFYKKMLDSYLEFIPRKTPKSQFICEVENSDVERLVLLNYLQSSDNYYIKDKYYEILLSKISLFLCEDHINRLRKHIVSKGKSCTNCGENYSIAESKHFGLDIFDGFHTFCRRCHQDSIMQPIISKAETQGYKLYCVDCKRYIEYDKNAFGNAKPRYIIKECPYCGGDFLQYIETVKYVWF